MDEFARAFSSVQVIVSKATSEALVTAQGTALSTLDTINNNNIASTTATTLNKIGGAIDTICINLGLGER
jgi:hypothetical protein